MYKNAVWQGASGKYYCKIKGRPSVICQSPDQPTGAYCDPLPPTSDGQGCAYAGRNGVVKKETIIQRISGFRNFTGSDSGFDLKTNSIFLGSSALGGFVANRITKNADKKTLNTVIGVGAGLIVGILINKSINK